MTRLTEHQDKLLRDLSDIIRRGRGRFTAWNFLWQARLIARVGLWLRRRVSK